MNGRAGIRRDPESGRTNATNVDNGHGVIGNRDPRNEKLEILNVRYAGRS